MASVGQSGYQSPSLPEEYANGSDAEEMRGVLRPCPRDQPVFDPPRKDLGVIAFGVHEPPAVVHHGFQQLAVAQGAEGDVRARWRSRLVRAGQPYGAMPVGQELRVVQTLCLFGAELAVSIRRQGRDTVVERSA